MSLGAELCGILITRLTKERPISWVVETGDTKGTDGLSVVEMLPALPAPP